MGVVVALMFGFDALVHEPQKWNCVTAAIMWENSRSMRYWLSDEWRSLLILGTGL
jgi:hypothetical protein